ncbi:FAD-dependent monooxygenase [Actinocrispum wychmicini]|uniref:3-(3-hydroxy-phenyl)propionate hydroxylase n=1 Tax=Actinocrispum wychmicini TaxID=1213861 RepID=A0A4R2JYY3_9PSEU|nr:FAD-dependent monooxygenase [Actinocrispum wychmicini]TCO62626.1 3-(3-hydroxy-phenyl)propionate hydroxylase [Actinocrispum wychmicini]
MDVVDVDVVDVIVAGAGPTGLMLACELRLAGVNVLLVDQLAERGTTESRAGGLHARTMEVLDQRGLADRFLAAGRQIQAGHFSGLRLDFTEFPTRYPFTLGLLQHRVERLLEERAAELGVQVRWSSPVIELRQDETGVEVVVGGDRFRAAYLVGCDGGRSTIRKLAGIDFPGTEATMTALLGDVEMAAPPDDTVFMERHEHGDYSVIAFEPGWYRVFTAEYDHVADRDAPMTFEILRESVVRIAGTDFGMHSPRWVSRYNDTARLASRYREGRVLLAGDAAHIHYPAGGQGLNMGVQDAVNLGWKLAAVLQGRASDTLLDTYQTERQPVAERVLRNTRAQSALGRPGAHMDAMRAIMAGLITKPDVNEALGSMIGALDIQYPLGSGHPLIGRRVPDLDLKTDSGPTRLYELLHTGRPVLLDLGAGVSAPNDWVDVVRAQCDAEEWPIPVLGTVPAARALLIRPDGHVAWVDGSGNLTSALTTWS